MRSLTVEFADLKVTLAEVRLAFATDRTQALELPNPLPKRAELKLDSRRASTTPSFPSPVFRLPDLERVGAPSNIRPQPQDSFLC